MNGFSTIAVHGAGPGKDPHRALRPPLYDTVAFEFSKSTDAELAFAGKMYTHTYSRMTNPTVEELEKRVQSLSNAFGVIAVASGMAAISNVVMTLAEAGANVVVSRYLFSHTMSLFQQTLNRWGLETRITDMTSPDSIEKCIDSKTRFVFFETISNPQLEVVDIHKICRIAAAKNVPVVVDSTLTTPYLFNSKEAGVAVEVLSSTKYISGGATSVGGLIIDNGLFDWAQNPNLKDVVKNVGENAFMMKLRLEVHRNSGACLSPHNAWLHILGLETLALRISKSSENALAVARFLEKSPKVGRVNYPGLQRSPWHVVASAQFKRGFGGLLTFELHDKAACFMFMDKLKLIRKATNLNDNKSLIIHPASTIFAQFTADQRARMSIPDSLLRLSVGIEDTEDIIDDIRQALEVL